MLEVLIIAILVAFIRGLSILHWEVFVPVAVVVLTMASSFVVIFADNKVKIESIRPFVVMAAYIAFLIPLLINHNVFNFFNILVFLLLFIVGSFLNRIVIKANDGKMPVYPYITENVLSLRAVEKLKSNPSYIVGSKAAKYKPLSDWIDVGYNVYSPGDIINLSSFGFLMYELIKYLN